MSTILLGNNPEYEARYDSDGLLRWTSNDALVPLDSLITLGVPSGYDLTTHGKAVRVEIDKFIRSYAEFRATNGYSAEEKAEIANEIGRDAVDVVTGKRIF